MNRTVHTTDYGDRFVAFKRPDPEPTHNGETWDQLRSRKKREQSIRYALETVLRGRSLFLTVSERWLALHGHKIGTTRLQELKKEVQTQINEEAWQNFH